MKYKGTYYSNFYGTEEYQFFIANSIDDAEDYMEVGLPEYCSEWEHLAYHNYELDMLAQYGDGWENSSDVEDFYDSCAYNNFCEDCGFYVERVSEVEEDLNNKRSWIDIRDEN